MSFGASIVPFEGIDGPRVPRLLSSRACKPARTGLHHPVIEQFRRRFAKSQRGREPSVSKVCLCRWLEWSDIPIDCNWGQR